jgi:hypothetical protein
VLRTRQSHISPPALPVDTTFGRILLAGSTAGALEELRVSLFFASPKEDDLRHKQATRLIEEPEFLVELGFWLEKRYIRLNMTFFGKATAFASASSPLGHERKPKAARRLLRQPGHSTATGMFSLKFPGWLILC